MNASSAGLAIDQGEEREVLQQAPPVPASLEETGLSGAFVDDLISKTLYIQGSRTGDQLATFVRLPFAILDEQLMTLQQRRVIEVRGTQGKGRRGYTFALTDEGRKRCREIMATNRYVGPAPVPLEQYRAIVERQKVEDAEVDEKQVNDGLEHLVLDAQFLDALGPAINSGRSLFLYGHAGNGKTVISEAIAQMLGDAIAIPYALEVEGQVITVYDPIFHSPVDRSPDEDSSSAWVAPTPDYDMRWLQIRRPVVMVGGELMLDDLELQFDRLAGAFRAPPQMKANGGVFIIDDFGRQRVRPRDLLNRWMVPLEKHVDFLSLPMGHKLPVPFQCLLIFATNLDPAELVEEAFLRRIRYKILVDNPSREEYAEILRRECENRGLEMTPEAVDLLFDEYYSRPHIAARCCHPRDIANHLMDVARYKKRTPEMTPEMLRMACDAYFLEVAEPGDRAGDPGRWNAGSSLEAARDDKRKSWREQDRLDPGIYDG